MTVAREARASLAARVTIGLVLTGAAVWVVLNSAFFAVRDVRVTGARDVSYAEIVRIAEVVEGQNLITLATADVSARLEDHPWIAHAFVERDLPSTVVIRVEERRPGGWLEDRQGPVIVAGDGTILIRRQEPPRDLPAIGEWPETLAPGDRVEGVAVELGVTSEMSDWLQRRVESADLDDGDVNLELRAGGVVLYGTPTEIADKNSALEEMLRWAEGEQVEVESVDVRVPSAPSLAPVRGRPVTETILTP